MKFGAHPDAEEDVLRAAEYLENAQLGYGENFFDAITKLWESICDNPSSLQRWHFHPRKRHLRFGLLRKFRYVVLFEVRKGETFIYSVTHTSRHTTHATRHVHQDKPKE